MNELIYASATQLARAIRAKEVSSEDVVEAYLERIEKVNHKLNAVVQLTADAARAQALEADAALARGQIKGPLHGVPMTIKDNMDTAGVICTSGTRGNASFVPKRDGPVVARMRAAGAILLGKTNLPELALAFETDNLVYGRTNNPYDLSRTPGGSSGGEAAIIAAGGSPVGLGNDYGGSVRLPSHFCGIAGLKPTAGRVPRSDLSMFSYSPRDVMLHVGPMARFVEDLILTLPIIAGVDWRDPSVVPMPLGDPEKVDLRSLRAAYHTNNGIVPPTPETAKVVQKTAEAFSEEGIRMEEDCPKGIDETLNVWNEIFASAVDGGSGLKKLFQIIGTREIHSWMQGTMKLCHDIAVSTSQFADLTLHWGRFCVSLLSFMEKYDVIICPVCASPALPHGGSYDPEKVPILAPFSYTMSYNITGWPAAVVRAGTSPEGLPIGVQVVARPWRDDVALAVAQHIESVTGGWQRPKL
jgi:amidase